MREITLEELLEAGCHFGHQVTRQNPKARDFIFEARDNIHIIDLAKTKEGLEEAAAFIKALAEKGGTLVVVGTKRQVAPIVIEEINRAVGQEGLFFVTSRWIGGTLTNFAEVSKNFKKLKDLSEKLQDKEKRAGYTKKEIGRWEKERQHLEGFYGGIAGMKKTPDAIFVIDTHLEELAVKEAGKMGVTTVGIVDTNADPNAVNYPIPANDDAVGSVKLITSYIIDAWLEGKEDQRSILRQNSGQAIKDQNLEIEESKNKETEPKTKTKKKEEKNGKRKSGAAKKAA